MGELFNIEKVLGFCEKICYFFIVNLLFIVSNLLALLFLLFVGAGQIRECLPLFLLSLLPMAPALSAVMYTMTWGRTVIGYIHMLDEHRILYKTDKDTSACGIIYHTVCNSGSCNA